MPRTNVKLFIAKGLGGVGCFVIVTMLIYKCSQYLTCVKRCAICCQQAVINMLITIYRIYTICICVV